MTHNNRCDNHIELCPALNDDCTSANIPEITNDYIIEAGSCMYV